MHELKTREREGECWKSRSGKFCERRKRKSVTVFKKVSSGATVGRSARPGAWIDTGPPRQRAWSFNTSCCLGLCCLYCDGSRERTLCIQLPDASVFDRDVASRSCRYSQRRYSHHRGPSRAHLSCHRWSALDRNRGWRSFCKAARVKSVSELMVLRLISSQWHRQKHRPDTWCCSALFREGVAVCFRHPSPCSHSSPLLLCVWDAADVIKARMHHISRQPS